jgi:hypothetical protein
MSVMTTSMAFRTLKATLDNIVTDPTDNVEKNVRAKKYMETDSMADHYVDDLENGGPGLLSERDEGQALDVGTLYEGAVTRYIARKFGKILELTDELEDDGKYNARYINFARRLKRAGWKTVDVDCANILNRAANAAYVGGDGQPLASASHTIPGGGTFSNTLATPMSPSRTALITVIQNCLLLPGHDGLTEGYNVKKVVHPVAQWGAWKGILGSEKVPESAANEINVVSGMGIEQVDVPFWSASTTNWGVITDAPEGLKLKWKKKFSSQTWVEQRTQIICHSTSGRWARGWSNARSFYFSNA